MSIISVAEDSVNELSRKMTEEAVCVSVVEALKQRSLIVRWSDGRKNFLPWSPQKITFSFCCCKRIFNLP